MSLERKRSALPNANWQRAIALQKTWRPLARYFRRTDSRRAHGCCSTAWDTFKASRARWTATWASCSARRTSRFRPRPEMEHDPSFKQLIPYVIFRHRDATGGEYGLSIHARQRPGRGPAAPQAERRHRRAHLGRSTSAADGSGNPYEEGMRRELDEEVVDRHALHARAASA